MSMLFSDGIPPTDEYMIGRLVDSGNYRIQRRLTKRTRYEPDDKSEKKLGMIVDVETTGLDHAKDEVIELGMLVFEFNADGKIFRVGSPYSEFRAPANRIPPEITKLTGITDEMVAGHTISTADIEGYLDNVSVVIAHNAAFDRGFCERTAPLFASHAWACSCSEIDWRAEGYEGSKLAYLLMGAGLFHDAHRAIDDCYALLEILSRPLPVSGEIGLKRLLDTARKTTYRIWAEKSPFETKDILKARGYHWSDGSDGAIKAWWVDVSQEQYDAEMSFLSREIYLRPVDLPTKKLTAFDRFSARAV